MFRSALIFLFVALASFEAQAKFFSFQTKFFQALSFDSMKSGKELMPPSPKFVFSEGTFHFITQEQYPFYNAHQQSTVYFGHCYNPNENAPMGMLWWQSMNNPSKTKRNNYGKLYLANSYKLHYHFTQNAICEFCDLSQAKKLNLTMPKFPREQIGLRYKK